jgi:hypothetical protein
VTDVRDLLKDGIQKLGREPANARFHRAAVATYLQGAPSQAAARLGLPFGTYRRHLTRVIESLCERLWYAEIFGTEKAVGGGLMDVPRQPLGPQRGHAH